jgi:hypothetical protein
MKFKIAFFILLTFLTSNLSIVAFAEPEPPLPSTINPAGLEIDPSEPAWYSLGVCEVSGQLDCIQSVYVKSISGDFTPSVPEGIQEWVEEIDSNSNTVYRSGMSWTIPQLESSTFQLDASVRTPSFVWSPDFSAGRLDVGASSLPRGYSVKVAVRTSWIKAQNLQFISDDSSFTQEPIDGVEGAYLWTFTGTHARVAAYTDPIKQEKTTLDPMDWSEAADIDYYSLDFVIHHAGLSPETTWWDPRCSDYGFTAQAFNSNAAGSPEWIDETGSLEFNIFAPHYDSRGAPHVNQGFFRLWIHEEFAECQWPNNTLIDADALEVLIVNEDGTEQDATTLITKEGGIIYLEAVDFHYSVPTFIIRPRSDTSNVDTPPTEGPGSKVSTPTVVTQTPATIEETSNTKPSKYAEPEERTPRPAALSADSDSNQSPDPFFAFGLLVSIALVVLLELFRRRRSTPGSHRRI